MMHIGEKNSKQDESLTDIVSFWPDNQGNKVPVFRKIFSLS